MNEDYTALQRLLPFVEAGIEAQAPAVRDQLWVAFWAGNTSIRTEPSVVGAVVIGVVDGYDVCEVDVRIVLDGD